METSSLIIDARHHLTRPQRLLSRGLTALLWGLWLSLWLPALGLLARLGGLRGLLYLVAQPAAYRLPHTLSGHLLTLLATAGALGLWARLSQRRPPAGPRPHEREPSPTDYARDLGADPDQVAAGRDAAIVVVHHDNTGRIVAIEARPR
ncbi:poly-beta-1,6-N-acetyl-D-glucosamine biosynthesis protein PgaD [Crenobacter luteus]|uniref:Poly-beta-1,6-N-acetyl-D-glucosamine biosynthesis protein PgaD n=1 Tax=Crenobacter luteus TaxID=1452487 RepID=A0A165G5A8_9NEIS|nr:poly-beta-1,6-N-acetyl-D-glucosamine biosynthesis protein PgaD [Crenobacter luteus]KZE35145.1 hypothetical protein AVW16_05065 [Crenobacter luteus]